MQYRVPPILWSLAHGSLSPRKTEGQDLGSAWHGDSTTLTPFCLRLVASAGGPIGKSSRRSYPDKDTMEVTLGIVLAIGLAFIWVVQGFR